MIEIIGWMSSALFAISPVPQAWKSFKEKHSKGISGGTLWIWFTGEALAFVYVSAQSTILWPLVVNYIFNLLFIGIILYYKHFPSFIAVRS